MKAAKQKKGPLSRLLTNGLPCEPTHDEIALCAYSLWEQQGRLQNQVEIWLQAETQFRQSQPQHGLRV